MSNCRSKPGLDEVSIMTSRWTEDDSKNRERLLAPPYLRELVVAERAELERMRRFEAGMSIRASTKRWLNEMYRTARCRRRADESCSTCGGAKGKSKFEECKHCREAK